MMLFDSANAVKLSHPSRTHVMLIYATYFIVHCSDVVQVCEDVPYLTLMLYLLISQPKLGQSFAIMSSVMVSGLSMLLTIVQWYAKSFTTLAAR
jgi:hypothetical protein